MTRKTKAGGKPGSVIKQKIRYLINVINVLSSENVTGCLTKKLTNWIFSILYYLYNMRVSASSELGGFWMVLLTLLLPANRIEYTQNVETSG